MREPATRERSQERARSWLREGIRLALLVVAILGARSTLADHYVVPSGSMEDTLFPGDRVFVDKRAYGLRVPFTSRKLRAGEHAQRGDIAIFDSPEDGTRLIKRVVAVAGDRVTVSRGHLLLGGKPLADPDNPSLERFDSGEARLSLRFGGGPELDDLVVPEGHVLVMGDARGNSRDSRYFGFIAEGDLYGRALGIYYRSSEGLTWLGL